MTVVRSVAVKNVHNTSTAPFWPGGGKELHVEFGADSGGTCSVRGIDPDDHKVVFRGVIRTAQQDRFLEAVRAGRQGTLVHNENAPVGHASTAQPGSDPGRVWYVVPLVAVAPGAADNGNLPFTVGAFRGTARFGLSSDLAPADDQAVVISGGDPHPP